MTDFSTFRDPDENPQYVPENPDVDHPVWTGLAGIEDAYARRHFPKFRIFRTEDGSDVNLVVVSLGAGRAFPNGVFPDEDDTEEGSLLMAAESASAVHRRFPWALRQARTGSDDGSPLEDYKESVWDEGPGGELQEKGFVPPRLRDRTYTPRTRPVGHKVWTGLTGKEDVYARENLPIFYVAVAEGAGIDGREYINAGSGEAAQSLLMNTGGSSAREINVVEWLAIAAESFEVISEGDRYTWAFYQWYAAQNGWDVDENLAAEGYRSHAEAVMKEGPYRVLQERGEMGLDFDLSDVSPPQMEEYITRVDLRIKAPSQPEANDFVSEILNPHLSEGLGDAQVGIEDWALGPSEENTHQPPVNPENSPFGHFGAVPDSNHAVGVDDNAS